MLTLTGRLGCFFMLIGAGILIVYLASDQARSPQVNFLVVGVFACLIGFGLWRKGRLPSPPSRRFRILRGRYTDDEDSK